MKTCRPSHQDAQKVQTLCIPHVQSGLPHVIETLHIVKRESREDGMGGILRSARLAGGESKVRTFDRATIHITLVRLFDSLTA